MSILFFFLKLVFSKKRNSFFHKTYRDILLNFFQFLCILNIQVFSLPNRFLRCKFLKKNVTLSKNLMITELNKQILILFQISVAPSHQKSDFRAINFFPHFHRNFFIFMFNTSVYIYFQKNQIQCNTKKKKKRRKRTCWSKTPPGLKNFISFMKKQIRIWKNFTKRNSAFGESISQYDLNTLKEIWWQQQNFVTFNREPRKSFLKVEFKLFLNVSDCMKT